MLDVFVAGTIFPQNIKVPQNINLKEQERLAYGQFKKIYENRGDLVTAGKFLSLELDAYSMQLKGEKGKKGEKINLWLNKFSSDHGNDWLRALALTFYFTIITFITYLILIGYYGERDFYRSADLLSYIFEFLNPIRKGDFLKDSGIRETVAAIKPLARTWDYFSRLIIAYFAYQTIQAFRRFGRKS